MLLDSLKAQTLGCTRFEVVVVDDASNDGQTSALLERECKRGELNLSVVAREQSAGPAAARNEGWRIARAPFIAFTDDDCRVSPGWLQAGLGLLREDPAAIVQGPTQPDPAEYDRYGPFTHTLTIDRLGPYYETCNIFYPRALLAELGGFDEHAFSMPGGEDTDLAWKAIRGSRETVFAPQAQVFHAVEWRGPLGMLRHAAHWHETVAVFAR
jgi:glycosyltransferase involved in cell wall biosynthesis